MAQIGPLPRMKPPSGASRIAGLNSACSRFARNARYAVCPSRRQRNRRERRHYRWQAPKRLNGASNRFARLPMTLSEGFAIGFEKALAAVTIGRPGTGHGLTASATPMAGIAVGRPDQRGALRIRRTGRVAPSQARPRAAGFPSCPRASLASRPLLRPALSTRRRPSPNPNPLSVNPAQVGLRICFNRSPFVGHKKAAVQPLPRGFFTSAGIGSGFGVGFQSGDNFPR